MTSSSVSLVAATLGDAPLLSNLLELYIHDLSAIFQQVQLGPDGRFGYPKLPAYLDGSPGRFAFVIRQHEQVAGFVLCQRGSPWSDDPQILDIAEFFVLRRFRAGGVGRQAAELLWQRVPGRWMVRALAKNPDAVSFWRKVVTAYRRGDAVELERATDSGTWCVFAFDNSR